MFQVWRNFGKCALVELLVHVRPLRQPAMGELKLRVHPGFLRTLFLFLPLGKLNWMFLWPMWFLLTTQSFSCFGSNHLCHSSFIFSIRPSYRLWQPWNSCNIIISKFSEDCLTAWLTVSLACLGCFSDCYFWIADLDRTTHNERLFPWL